MTAKRASGSSTTETRKPEKTPAVGDNPAAEDDHNHFAAVARAVKGIPILVWASAAAVVVGVSVLLALAGIGGGDSDDRDRKNTAKAAKAEKPVDGSFVGEVSGMNAFVAVVAAPAEGNQDRRGVQIYVSDGRRLSEWFSGSIRNNSFVASSAAGSAQAKGRLKGDSVTGAVKLPGGKTVRYEASRPGGAAGLYELMISSDGELSGASAAGLGIKGEITLGRRGTGTLKLADGERLKFDVTRNPAGDLIRLGVGQVRLIILPGGELRGAGKSRRAASGGGSDFFIRSV